ncbi:hypothetical protein CYPRO_0089 [Cyclonatronum proteinivorum]|uniref:Uncharacterized protein n=1 Tax=Cyclonatronum proteinivorum TaxID=1457365 RepID=A0A345UFX6_9BACT|nr:hypothetical protein CYPRO_0089 [Cyclonatronum proteinivorum]
MFCRFQIYGSIHAGASISLKKEQQNLLDKIRFPALPQPSLTVEAAVLNSFRNVMPSDVFAPLKVGNGS